MYFPSRRKWIKLVDLTEPSWLLWFARLSGAGRWACGWGGGKRLANTFWCTYRSDSIIMTESSEEKRVFHTGWMGHQCKKPQLCAQPKIKRPDELPLLIVAGNSCSHFPAPPPPRWARFDFVVSNFRLIISCADLSTRQLSAALIRPAVVVLMLICAYRASIRLRRRGTADCSRAQSCGTSWSSRNRWSASKGPSAKWNPPARRRYSRRSSWDERCRWNLNIHKF